MITTPVNFYMCINSCGADPTGISGQDGGRCRERSAVQGKRGGLLAVHASAAFAAVTLPFGRVPAGAHGALLLLAAAMAVLAARALAGEATVQVARRRRRAGRDCLPEGGDAAPAERARDGAGEPRHLVGLHDRAQVHGALEAQLVPAHCNAISFVKRQCNF